MEPPFAILTTDKYGSIASEHSIGVDAEGEFMATEVRGSEAGRMCEPFGMLLTDARKRTKGREPKGREPKGRELNFILAATLDLQCSTPEPDWIASETTVATSGYPAGAKILPYERSAT